jgi:tetratricopeptide (TPR) repeat protein
MSGSSPRPEELRAAARAVARARAVQCPPEEMLLSFHAASLSPEEEEGIRDHLAVCASCGEVGRDARRFLEAMGQRPRPAIRPPWHRPVAAAAGLALALGAAWAAGLLRPRESSRQASRTPPPGTAVRVADAWADLAIAKAPYEPGGSLDEEIVFRSEGRTETAPSELDRAMEAYGHDDFAAAERELAAHLSRHPEDHRASFYRGVALLMQGRARQAQPPLAKAAAGEGGTALEARYYLALACLKAGDTAAAATHLEAVDRSSPERRDEARALRRRLRAADAR